MVLVAVEGDGSDARGGRRSAGVVDWERMTLLE